MKKSIIVGKEGKLSMAGVFAAMQTLENNMIVKNLSKKLNTNYFKLYNEGDTEQFTKVKSLAFDEEIVIRWGTRVEIPETNCIVYNGNKALSNASNKYLARKILFEAGVNIPKLTTPENFQLEDLPIIARPFQHKQGKDFVAIKDYGSFVEFYKKNSGTWYFSAYVEKDQEYRVHCASGKILSIMKKPKPDDPTILAWNHSIIEAEFEAVKWSEWNIDLCKLSLQACTALGLDFAALDVIEKDGIFYILEANTSPSLTTSLYNTEKYAKYFDWLFRKNEKREPWEYESKKKAASLAWKDWMFEDREPNAKK